MADENWYRVRLRNKVLNKISWRRFMDLICSSDGFLNIPYTADKETASALLIDRQGELVVKFNEFDKLDESGLAIKGVSQGRFKVKFYFAPANGEFYWLKPLLFIREK